MSTTAQRWAQKRNFHKARIMGARSVCQGETLTPSEYKTLQHINLLLRSLITTWDSNNKESKRLYIGEK